MHELSPEKMWNRGENVLRSLFEAITDFECGHLFGQARSEIGVDGGLHVNSVGTDTSLATPAELANDSS